MSKLINLESHGYKFDEFPSEVKYKIIHYLELSDLPSIFLISQKFYILSLSETFWKEWVQERNTKQGRKIREDYPDITYREVIMRIHEREEYALKMRNRSKQNRQVAVKLMLVGSTEKMKLKEYYLETPSEDEYTVTLLEDLLYCQSVKLEIYDPKKEEEVEDKLHRVLQKQVHGVFVIFDCSVKSSFKKVMESLKDRLCWKEDCMFTLVGIHSDNIQKGIETEIQDWLKSTHGKAFNMEYIKIQEFDSSNTLTLFHSLIRKCLQLIDNGRDNEDDSDILSGLLTASPVINKKKDSKGDGEMDREKTGGCLLL